MRTVKRVTQLVHVDSNQSDQTQAGGSSGEFLGCYVPARWSIHMGARMAGRCSTYGVPRNRVGELVTPAGCVRRHSATRTGSPHISGVQDVQGSRDHGEMRKERSEGPFSVHQVLSGGLPGCA